MKDFIIENLREIIVLSCFLIEMIILSVAIIKKGKKGTTLYTDILMSLPEIISNVEFSVGIGHGAEKLKMVLDIVSDIVLKESGEKITHSEYKFFSSIIEKILETPQKKEIKK